MSSDEADYLRHALCDKCTQVTDLDRAVAAAVVIAYVQYLCELVTALRLLGPNVGWLAGWLELRHAGCLFATTTIAAVSKV